MTSDITFSHIFLLFPLVKDLTVSTSRSVLTAHLVADPSGKQLHELWGLEALNLPVLNGIAAKEVVQLGGQHGTCYLLVPGRLLTWNRDERLKKLVECLKLLGQILSEKFTAVLVAFYHEFGGEHEEQQP